MVKTIYWNEYWIGKNAKNNFEKGATKIVIKDVFLK